MDDQANKHRNLPAEILREVLTEKIAVNTQYSVRAFARDIGVSASYASMLLNGKRSLSYARAKEIARALGLKSKRRLSFLRSIVIQTSGQSMNAEEFRNLSLEQAELGNIFPIDIDKFKFFNHWYHVAILDLTTCSGFQSNTAWIASRLGLSPLIIDNAIDRLMRLKLLENSNGRIQKASVHLSLVTNQPSSVIRNFHRQMIKKATSHLDSDDQLSFNKREISGITMSIDPSKIALAKERIGQFKRDMAALLSIGDCSEVYQLNLQFFPLTKPSGES